MVRGICENSDEHGHGPVREHKTVHYITSPKPLTLGGYARLRGSVWGTEPMPTLRQS